MVGHRQYGELRARGARFGGPEVVGPSQIHSSDTSFDSGDTTFDRREGETPRKHAPRECDCDQLSHRHKIDRVVDPQTLWISGWFRVISPPRPLATTRGLTLFQRVRLVDALAADEPNTRAVLDHRPGWIYEETYDGWRMLAYSGSGTEEIVPRRSSSVPPLSPGVAILPPAHARRSVTGSARNTGCRVAEQEHCGVVGSY
jgi:hypothetical protein